MRAAGRNPGTQEEEAYTMKASELSEEAKARAYRSYCAAMDDDINRENILPVDEWEPQADWDRLEFDANGDVIGEPRCRVREEYRNRWSNIPDWDGVTTIDEVERLAIEWEMTLGELMEQVEVLDA